MRHDIPAKVRRLLGAVGWCFLYVWLCSRSMAATSLEQEIEARLGKPFAHLVWTERWATFAEASRVAARLGCTIGQYDALVKQHPWMLQGPPALLLDQSEYSRAAAFGGAVEYRVSIDDFVADDLGAVPACQTRVELVANGESLRLSFQCSEPLIAQLAAETAEPEDAFERMVFEGDSLGLKTAAAELGIKELIRRAAAVPPRERSVFEDDCVFVRLTPLKPGENLSREFRVRDQRDAAELFSQLGPAGQGELALKGTYYTIAVNAAGVVHRSFYEPWEGGRFWGCWRPHVKVDCRRTTGQWRVDLTVPLDHLEPLMSRGAVWGLDVFRHRPARAGNPEQLARTRRTILLRFEGDGREVERRLCASGIDEASISKWTPTWAREADPRPEATVALWDREPGDGAWPTPHEWRQAAPLRRLCDGRTGQAMARRTEVRLLEGREDLFVRFDCDRVDARPLRVVTREEEQAAFPSGDRHVNWLDRRESFGGPDWGDHVEIQLAPGLGGSDPFHNGYYLILVNSRGDVLARYFDPCGAYSVDVAPWQPKAHTSVDVRHERWTVQIAIPFAVMFGLESAGRTWFANFLAHCGGTTAAWAPMFGSTREPGSFGRLLFERERRGGAGPGVPRLWPGVPSDAASPPAKYDRSRDRLLGVALAGPKVVAVGARGTVWQSPPAGAEGFRRGSPPMSSSPASRAPDAWQSSDSGVRYDLQAVQFVDADHGWAVGGWSRDPQVAICGGMGVILATDDGGRTWQPRWRDQGPWLYGLSWVSDKIGYVCGGYGTVLKTTDGGRTWQGPLPTGTNAWLYDVHFVDERQGWAVGNEETILHTDDGGRSWQRQTADSFRRSFDLREQLCAVHFVDSTHGWAAGERGTVLRTTDGANWKRLALGIAEELVDLLEPCDVYFADRSAGWIVGRMGSAVLRTEDGGASWALARTGFRGGLSAVTAADRNHVWAVGERGTRLESIDGGRTWQVIGPADRPSWALVTPHDHHLKNWAGVIAATADQVDWVTVRPGRGAFYFEPYLDYYRQRWLAGTEAVGAVIIREWHDLLNSRRREPQFIHHAYQLYGGPKPLTRRLTALFRLVQPEVVFTEWPVFAEGYWSWETGLDARCARDAYFAAGDAGQFPELEELGLKPWQPAELYSQADWWNTVFGVAPGTHLLVPSGGDSDRLGDRLRATARSAGCWEGLMDRARPTPNGGLRRRPVHLVHRAQKGKGLSRPQLDLKVESPPP